MFMMSYRCVIDEKRCVRCRFCEEVIYCPLEYDGCIGCEACSKGCPYDARQVIKKLEPKLIRVEIDGSSVMVPEGITIKRALELAGFKFTKFPDKKWLFAPCEVGGCYSCIVTANGKAVRSCVTPIHDGMVISTKSFETYEPIRVIHGPSPHTVGGKATPWWLKSRSYYIEVAIWAGGCNLRCPQCQNYSTTYDGRTKPLTPQEAATMVTRERRFWGVDRMAISGGEPTLNRRWLVEYFKELKRLNADPEARLHLDSNGTILTKDYIDELVDVGVTDIGVEPKGVTIQTFMRITGIEEQSIAEMYLKTAWEAVEYIVERYSEKVFLGVGLPYNKALISLEEVISFGEKISSIDPELQLCVLDYFPTFKRRDIKRPQPAEMLKVKKVLEECGLKTVIVQTSIGHFGPEKGRFTS